MLKELSFILGVVNFSREFYPWYSKHFQRFLRHTQTPSTIFNTDPLPVFGFGTESHSEQPYYSMADTDQCIRNSQRSFNDITPIEDQFNVGLYWCCPIPRVFIFRTVLHHVMFNFFVLFFVRGEINLLEFQYYPALVFEWTAALHKQGAELFATRTELPVEYNTMECLFQIAKMHYAGACGAHFSVIFYPCSCCFFPACLRPN